MRALWLVDTAVSRRVVEQSLPPDGRRLCPQATHLGVAQFFYSAQV